MKKTCPKCSKTFTSATFKYCYSCNIAKKSCDDNSTEDNDDKQDDIKFNDDLDK